MLLLDMPRKKTPVSSLLKVREVREHLLHPFLAGSIVSVLLLPVLSFESNTEPFLHLINQPAENVRLVLRPNPSS